MLIFIYFWCMQSTLHFETFFDDDPIFWIFVHFSSHFIFCSVTDSTFCYCVNGLDIICRFWPIILYLFVVNFSRWKKFGDCGLKIINACNNYTFVFLNFIFLKKKSGLWQHQKRSKSGQNQVKFLSKLCAFSGQKSGINPVFMQRITL